MPLSFQTELENRLEQSGKDHLLTNESWECVSLL